MRKINSWKDFMQLMKKEGNAGQAILDRFTTMVTKSSSYFTVKSICDEGRIFNGDVTALLLRLMKSGWILRTGSQWKLSDNARNLLQTYLYKEQGEIEPPKEKERDTKKATLEQSTTMPEVQIATSIKGLIKETETQKLSPAQQREVNAQMRKKKKK